MPTATRTLFTDRVDAGRQLATRMGGFAGTDTVVVGLPRGGVPVAEEVARALGAPLDVLAVRKLGLPFQPEIAMGAIGEGGVEVLDRRVLIDAGVTSQELEAVETQERTLLDQRLARYRRHRGSVPLAGRVVILVDDGMARGSTARAACLVARQAGAHRVVLAVPVASAQAVATFTAADEVVTVATPDPFVAVGLHYLDFSPTSDDEVVDTLERADRRLRRSAEAAMRPDCDIEVEIPVAVGAVRGHLHLPEPAQGVVVFAHGSGSSRHSPRNRFVADRLYEAGLGTLLLDLLTTEEERNRANVFDIELLSQRLVRATTWLTEQPAARGAGIGLFGASTGAAAALWAAVDLGTKVGAVVSRGGRPDLALARLRQVQAPTLLIVGGDDKDVLDQNRRARRLFHAPVELAVVEGATHLFEEPGALEQVADLAAGWFTRYLLPADELDRRDER